MGIPASAGSQSVGQRQHGIEIKWPDIPAWVPEETRQELNQVTLSVMELAIQLVAGYVSDNAPVDSGGLAQSFGAYPATVDGGISITGEIQSGITARTFSSLPHAIVMNDGRQPGKPISRVGVDALGLWAQRKLGLSAEEAERVKWAIANAIIKRGIPGTLYFDKGVGQATPAVQAMFTDLAQQIASALFTPTGKRRNTNLQKMVGRKVKGAKR